MYAAEVRAGGRGPRYGGLDVARRRGFVPLEKCLERETEIGAAYVRAMDALDSCYTRFDPICIRILSFGPHGQRSYRQEDGPRDSNGRLARLTAFRVAFLRKTVGDEDFKTGSPNALKSVTWWHSSLHLQLSAVR
jgi:hypothetical protein